MNTSDWLRGIVSLTSCFYTPSGSSPENVPRTRLQYSRWRISHSNLRIVMYHVEHCFQMLRMTVCQDPSCDSCHRKAHTVMAFVSWSQLHKRPFITQLIIPETLLLTQKNYQKALTRSPQGQDTSSISALYTQKVFTWIHNGTCCENWHGTHCPAITPTYVVLLLTQTLTCCLDLSRKACAQVM